MRRCLFAILVLAGSTRWVDAADSAPVQYTLRYDAATETMSVRACVARAASSIHFSAEDGAPRYLEPLTREHGSAPERDDDGWSAADWHAGECLAYRAALGRIVDSGARRLGARHGSAIVVDPDAWLVRVDDTDPGATAEVRLALPSGLSISAPWHPLPEQEGFLRFAVPETPQSWMERIAIGHFEEKPVVLPGGTLRVSILDGVDAAQRAKLDAWIAHVSRAALSAYGRFPLADVQVLLIPDGPQHEHDPVGFGQSTRGQGHAVTLFVDPAQSADAFDRDWVAVHEFSHLFHPYLDDRGSWLAEGLATYYQNVLRARAGLVTAAKAWDEIDAGFARGRGATKKSGDITLESAAQAESTHPNFMRIYWSGTAFWLEVDLELRRSSGNRLGIDEALRRFDACCLPDYRGWKPEDFVAKLDALIGSDVFRKKFAEFRERRDFPDLAPVYADLGIGRDGDALSFTDAAPAADVRRAIMTAPAQASAR